MNAHARLKNEFKEDEKCHNLMSRLKSFSKSDSRHVEAQMDVVYDKELRPLQADAMRQCD